MKKVIILLLGLLWAVGAFAQYVPEWHQGDLKKKGTVLALQGMKLDRATTDAILNQVGGADMVASWDKYCKLAAVGVAFGGVYLVAGLVGTIFAAIGGQEAVDKLWADLGPRVYIGGVGMIAGLAAGTTGIVLLSVGNSNLKKLARTCDAAGLGPQTGVQLALGPTPSGVGLALRF